MDGYQVEHSDSDSGDSWTLLDHSPSYADEAPKLPDAPKTDMEILDTDKDEDTDGISIISESEPESPCEHLIFEEHTEDRENRPSEQIEPAPPNDNSDEPIHDKEFLCENSGKLKTYVHKRNKRLSTVLNIIVLGSVITAAGIAIGHMWGVRDDCSINTTPSVNKILSNLYKLQEENAFLRSKIRELTSMQMSQKTSELGKVTKRQRCKKMFEEPLNSNNVQKSTKCVDFENDSKVFDAEFATPDFEEDFVHDISKLKNVYRLNKDWLDAEVSKRIKFEEENIKKMKNQIKNMKLSKDKLNNLKGQTIKQEVAKEMFENDLTVPSPQMFQNAAEAVSEKKISYADSLKSEITDQNRVVHKRSISEEPDVLVKVHQKKKVKKDLETISDITPSEEDLKKDDRYTSNKQTEERKKYDRQKKHKKQKRKNKYEQWEMKGGYMKNYDDFSIASAQDDEFVLGNADNNLPSRQFERINYISQFSESGDNAKKKDATPSVPQIKTDKHSLRAERPNEKQKEKDSGWYEKRATLRSEARRKLEKQLFGENLPNTAGWYFRRMQKREQCREKRDNSTLRKLAKRNMNYKIKH